MIPQPGQGGSAGRAAPAWWAAPAWQAGAGAALAAYLTLTCLDRLGPGADFFHYWSWAQAFLRGDYLIGQHGTLYACHHSPEVGLLWSLPLGLAKGLFALSQESLGNPFLYVALANLLMGLLTLALMLWAARRAGAGPLATAAGLGLGLAGTSLLPYALLHASSEAPSALLLLALTLLAWRGETDSRSFFALLGLLAGLAVGVRTHNVFAALPLLALAAWEQIKRGPLAESALRLFLLGLAGVISFLPMLATNLVMTGSPLISPVNFTLPDGSNPYFETWPRFLPQLLLSPRHGLLPYQPLWLLALAGAGLWLARDWRSLPAGRRRWPGLLNRPLAANVPYALLICLAAQVLVYASTRFWDAGQWSFGGRYFTALTPAAGLALVYLFQQLQGSRLARPLLLLAWLLAGHTFLLYAQGSVLSEFSSYAQMGRYLLDSLAALREHAPWLLILWPALMAASLWPGPGSWPGARRQNLAAACLGLWAISLPLALAALYPAASRTTASDWFLLCALAALAGAAMFWRLGRPGGLRPVSRAVILALWLLCCLYPLVPASRTLEMLAADPGLDARPRWLDPRSGCQGIITFEMIELDPEDPRLISLKGLLRPAPAD